MNSKYKIALISLGLSIIFTCLHSITFANYNLNFSDASSYSITCGKVTSWWTVKDDSCILTTAYMRVETDSSVLTCDFRLNQSGNLDIDDNAYIQYQLNNGEWVTDTGIAGLGLDAVWFRTFPLTLYYGDFVRFRVIYETNHQTEFWGLQNGDINISGNFEVYTEVPEPMPVEFTYIEGTANNNSVLINWITASETNNDYFSVERSDNGIDFYIIGVIDGAGNSNAPIEYSYADGEPILGNSFYRIKQTDFDGQYSFSETVSVNFNNSKEEISIYSAHHNVNVRIISDEPTDATLTIIDLKGNSVIKENFMLNEGENLLSSATGNLREGIYIICFAKSDGSGIIKKCLIN